MGQKVLREDDKLLGIPLMIVTHCHLFPQFYHDHWWLMMHLPTNGNKRYIKRSEYTQKR